MKLKKRVFIIALSCLFLMQSLLLLSCQKKTERFTTYSFDFFDTVTTIVGYAEDQAAFDKIANEILTELGEYHRLFTIYNRYDGLENLCTVNETVDGAHRTVTVDRRIIDLLIYAREMYDLTGGRVNIAMGSVLSIWHDYRQAGEEDPFHAELPPMEALAEAAAHTDINNMVIDREQNTVTLTDPRMRLDVGAIAKGYAVEMVAKSLYEKGITGYVLNVGGNVRAIGTKQDGEGWTAGIQNPNEDEGGYLAYLSLTDASLVTSGSYQRYYTVDGKRYHHIIDPDTLMPADRYSSVSVICEHSGMGDALSTALFCLPLEDGMALIEGLDGVEAMWVTVEGEQYTTSGFGGK